MKKKLTEVVFLVDRSGSMESIRRDMEGGFRTFVEAQKEDKNGKIVVSLFDFDTEYRELYENKDVNELPEFELVPRGGTALLDAVGKTLDSLSERYSNTKKKDLPGRVLVVIVTDGQENSSREYRTDAIKKLIEDKTENDKWEFVYLGANQDSFTVGHSIGIGALNTANYNTSSFAVGSGWNAISSGVLCARSALVSGGSYNFSFSEEHRAQMMV